MSPNTPFNESTGTQSMQPSSLPPFKPWGMELRVFALLMHLSQLLGFPLGLVVIVMWATNKDQSPFIHNHGKALFNWFISLFIYICIAYVLVFFCIGIPILIGLIVLSIVYMILGAVKANEGKIWKYPLSIPFFKVDDSIVA